MDYQNGKIYKITNCIDNEVYIGSTCSPLTKRWYQHKCECKRITLFKIYQHMNELGIDKFSISLVENYPCTNKSELFRREGELTRQLGTLNMCIPGRTHQEWNEDNKERNLEIKQNWNKNNKEKLTEYHKEYYKDNKETLSEKQKVYNENNKEQIAETKRKWNENNKEKRAIQRKEYREKIAEKEKEYREKNKEKLSKKIECNICKSVVTFGNISTHKKTKKCLAVSVGNKTDDSKSQA
jgi:hypothetical protein